MNPEAALAAFETCIKKIRVAISIKSPLLVALFAQLHLLIQAATQAANSHDADEWRDFYDKISLPLHELAAAAVREELSGLQAAVGAPETPDMYPSEVVEWVRARSPRFDEFACVLPVLENLRMCDWRAMTPETRKFLAGQSAYPLKTFMLMEYLLVKMPQTFVVLPNGKVWLMKRARGHKPYVARDLAAVLTANRTSTDLRRALSCEFEIEGADWQHLVPTAALSVHVTPGNDVEIVCSGSRIPISVVDLPATCDGLDWFKIEPLAIARALRTAHEAGVPPAPNATVRVSYQRSGSIAVDAMTAQPGFLGYRGVFPSHGFYELKFSTLYDALEAVPRVTEVFKNLPFYVGFQW